MDAIASEDEIAIRSIAFELTYELDESIQQWASYWFHTHTIDRSVQPCDLVSRLYIHISYVAHRYDGSKASFKTWLHRVAKNLWYAIYIKKSKQVTIGIDDFETLEAENTTISSLEEPSLLEKQACFKKFLTSLIERVMEKKKGEDLLLCLHTITRLVEAGIQPVRRTIIDVLQWEATRYDSCRRALVRILEEIFHSELNEVEQEIARELYMRFRKAT